MRVCMLLAGDCHSDSRVDREARTLVEHGHHVTVVARRGRDLPDAEVRHGYRIWRMPIGPRRPGRALTPAQRIELNMRTVAAAVRLEPDVCHAHDLRTMLAGSVVATRAGAALVYDSHELFVETETFVHRPWLKMLARRFESVVIRRAAEVITVNDRIADELSLRYGIRKPTVVMNCVDLPVPGAPARDLHGQLGLPRHVRIVLYQGGLTPYRGLDKLVECAARLPACVVVFIGAGSALPGLQRVAAERGLRDRVLFLGPVPMDELGAYTLAADVGVVPFQKTSLNNYYGSPNKLFEYIAAGVPVAVSDFPVMADIVNGCGVGATFDPENVDSMAAAIGSLLATKARTQELRHNVRRAAERYNWGAESKRLLAVYERLSQMRRL